MNLRIRVTILLLPLCIMGFTQPNRFGIPDITAYNFLTTGGNEQNWCITMDQRGILYLGNDSELILEYDGHEWRKIAVPNGSTIRSLATAIDGTVYVGAVGEIGYLSPDRAGSMQYHSLLSELDSTYHNFTDVWKSYTYNKKVYFCTQEYIMIYNSDVNSFRVIHTNPYTLFSFIINGTIYSGSFLSGLNILKEDTLVVAPGGNYYEKKDIFGLVKYDKDHLMISTTQDGITLYNINTGKVNENFLSETLQQYIRDSYVTHILKLSNGNFLLSTAQNGLIVISPGGTLTEVLNTKNGFPDNTVYYTFEDTLHYPCSSTWSALSYGLVNTQLNSPFRKLTPKMGFNGIIFDIAFVGDRLFAGTNNGLFYLSEGENYKDSFIKVQGIHSVNSLENFETGNREEVLLSISYKGLYEIFRDGRSVLLDRQIKNKKYPNRPYSGRIILRDPNNSDRILLADKTIIGLRYSNNTWTEEFNTGLDDQYVQTMGIDAQDYLWFTTSNSTGRVLLDAEKMTPEYFTTDKNLPVSADNQVLIVNQQVLISTSRGLFRYNEQENTFSKDSIYNPLLPEGNNTVYRTFKDPSGKLWFSLKNDRLGWTLCYLEENGDSLRSVTKPFLNLPDMAVETFYSQDNTGIWFSISKELYHYRYDIEFKEKPFHTLFRKIILGTDSILYNGTYPVKSPNERQVLSPGMEQSTEFIPVINHRNNNMQFQWSATYYESEDNIRFSYLMEGFDEEWSPWSYIFYKDFTNLSPGKYTMLVKAQNVYGDVSLPDKFSFVVGRPWYLTAWALILYIILLGFFTYIIYVLLINNRLRKLVDERTKEVNLQKERIEERNRMLENLNDEITAQRDAILKQKEQIDSQNIALTDSIKYARRIQDAVLPKPDVIQFMLPKHFVFYRPRDIVSGDFFWIDKRENDIIIALGDCTGHGVPGAFMSMLGISLMNEVVNSASSIETHEIMDELRDRLIQALKQTGDSEEAKDGMDMSMVRLNMKTLELQFTGAQQNLLLFRNGDLKEIRGDRMPVGIHTRASRHFTSTQEKLKKGDTFYLSSDGFPDQFGGPHEKKYGYPRFRKFLTEIQDMIMHDQERALEEEFDNWKNDVEQIDDVLILGIRI